MVVEPASPGHLLAMCALPPPLRLTVPAMLYRYLSAQIALSRSWALYEDDTAITPFAIVGLATCDDGQVEAFFIPRRGGLSGHLMLALVRFARRQFEGLDGRPCAGLVVDGNEAGARIARLCSFEPTAEMFGPARVWRR